MLNFRVIGPLLLLVIGVIGNTINIYAFTRKSLRGLSTFRFLLYLALFDLLYLMVGLGHLLVALHMDYDFRLYSDLVCSVHSFLTVYLAHLSSNVMAAVSVYRCVALTSMRPMRRRLNHGGAAVALNQQQQQQQQQPKQYGGQRQSSADYLMSRREPLLERIRANMCRADQIVALIMLVLFLVDCHYLIWMRTSSSSDSQQKHNDQAGHQTASGNDSSTAAASERLCNPSRALQPVYYQFVERTFVWIDLLLYSYIPFSIMMACTVLISYRLYQINKSTRQYNTLSVKTASISHAQLQSQEQQLQQQQQQQSQKRPNTRGSKELEQVTTLTTAPTTTTTMTTLTFKRKKRKGHQTYKLLLTINIYFFILVTPLVLCNSFDILNNNEVLFEAFYMLAYSNHCFNFLFYGFSCEIYRKIVADMFKCTPVKSNLLL